MQCFKANETVSAIVADTVLKHMEKGGTGEVLMVNSAGVYLSAGGEVWLICDISWGSVPIGIAIDDFNEQVTRLCVQQGEKFSYRKNELVFSGRTLRLNALDSPKFENHCGTPVGDLINQAAQDIVDLRKERGISMLALPLILGGKVEDVLTLNPYCTRAYPLLSRLMQALTCESCIDIIECVNSLLGLGAGLTPSADDVMLGMLYAFRKLGNNAPKSVDTFRDNVLDMCDTHTNKISAAYLKSVVSGAHFGRIEKVWRGLCGEEPLDTSSLFDVGGSSGTEILLGILIALRVYQCK